MARIFNDGVTAVTAEVISTAQGLQVENARQLIGNATISRGGDFFRGRMFYAIVNHSALIKNPVPIGEVNIEDLFAVNEKFKCVLVTGIESITIERDQPTTNTLPVFVNSDGSTEVTPPMGSVRLLRLVVSNEVLDSELKPLDGLFPGGITYGGNLEPAMEGRNTRIGDVNKRVGRVHTFNLFSEFIDNGRDVRTSKVVLRAVGTTGNIGTISDPDSQYKVKADADASETVKEGVIATQKYVENEISGINTDVGIFSVTIPNDNTNITTDDGLVASDINRRYARLNNRRLPVGFRWISGCEEWIVEPVIPAQIISTNDWIATAFRKIKGTETLWTGDATAGTFTTDTPYPRYCQLTFHIQVQFDDLGGSGGTTQTGIDPATIDNTWTNIVKTGGELGSIKIVRVGDNQFSVTQQHGSSRLVKITGLI